MARFDKGVTQYQQGILEFKFAPAPCNGEPIS